MCFCARIELPGLAVVFVQERSQPEAFCKADARPQVAAGRKDLAQRCGRRKADCEGVCHHPEGRHLQQQEDLQGPLQKHLFIWLRTAGTGWHHHCCCCCFSACKGQRQQYRCSSPSQAHKINHDPPCRCALVPIEERRTETQSSCLPRRGVLPEASFGISSKVPNKCSIISLTRMHFLLLLLLLLLA